MSARRLFLLAITTVLVVIAPCQAQNVYKSVGPDGVVVYGDRPPAAGKVDKTLNFDNLPTSTLPPETQSYVEQLKRLQASSPTPAPNDAKGVILYTTAWCGYCKRARAYLSNRGIAFQDVDVENPAGREAYARAGGGKGIPLLVAGKRRVQGFSPSAYDAIFSESR